MNSMPKPAEMQRAYLKKDASYNGVFFLGVRTTSIFCRPSCPARTPHPKNVEYFPSARAALFAGYRPCKRCHPMDDDEQPNWARKLIAVVERTPGVRIRDSELKKRGVDPATARRYFQRRYGMTFQAYTRARRLTGALQRIREGAALDPTIFDSGYASHSGFREAFTKLFGKTPRAARSPQQGEVVLLSWVRSPLGPLVTGATEDGVCLVEFSDRRMLEKQFATISRVFSGPIVPGSNRHSEALARELSEYFAGQRRHFDVPIVSPGSPFQRRVWEALMQVPYGQTCSYQDIATAVGDKRAVRAVGTANGANRIAIVIPCHRVVNKGGKLGGYGGGLWRKQYLIDLERGDRLC